MVWAVGGPKWRSLRLYLGLHTPLLGPDPAEEHQNIQKQSKPHEAQQLWPYVNSIFLCM